MRSSTRRFGAVAGVLLLAACTSSTSAAPPRPGGQIAFSRATPDDRHEQIYLQPADGSDVRQVVRSNASDADPALSPDGRRLVFTRHVDGEPDRIFTVGVDGSGLRQIVPSGCPQVCGDAVEGAAWSPDAGRLVFTRTTYRGQSLEPTAIEVWLMNADGSAARELTRAPTARTGGKPGAQDGFASWSPDGGRVLFTHSVHGTAGGLSQFSVETVKPDGTDRRPVTPNDVNASQAAWSPDGTLIAFQSPPDEEGVAKALYTIRPEGTGMTSLTNTLDGNDSEHPSWSPDSRQIVFAHLRPGPSTGADLYVVNRDGSDPHPLAVTPLDERAPSWSVDPS